MQRLRMRGSHFPCVNPWGSQAQVCLLYGAGDYLYEACFKNCVDTAVGSVDVFRTSGSSLCGLSIPALKGKQVTHNSF
jgi:hypothetical protein